jgi:hypothetical protein
MLELFFVDVDGNIGVEEVFEAAGVVEVEMSGDDSFDVFDVVSCGFDCGRESVFVIIDASREEVGHGDWGGRFEVLGTTGFEEN